MRDPVVDPLAGLCARLPDGDRLAAALPGPFRRAIRLHPRRGVPAGWGSLEPVPWHAQGRYHAEGIDPGGMLDYHTGLAWPQDAASQVPVLLLDPRPGETVVDACAAPGSKSTQIGIALGDEGLLVCCDAEPARRHVLAETLARQGVACALVTPMPLHVLAARCPGMADAVLVDAPCSGHRVRTTAQVARMARRQSAILAAAAALARPGGRVVYSTCTPWIAEDEGVVAAFLADHPGWSVEPVPLPGCDADLDGRGGLRLHPQRQGTEPFFAIRLRAPGDAPAEPPQGQRPEEVRALAPWLPTTALATWRRGDRVLAGSLAAASCALPSEARGIVIGRVADDALRLDPWAAQALIERGAACRHVAHADACRLWAGEELALDADEGVLLATGGCAPLGVAQHGAGGVRLALPSRMRRAGLR